MSASEVAKDIGLGITPQFISYLPIEADFLDLLGGENQPPACFAELVKVGGIHELALNQIRNKLRSDS